MVGRELCAPFGLVSRARCGILYAAPQNQDRTKDAGVWYGPGSAKQRFAKCYALHRARDTRAANYFSHSLSGTALPSEQAITPL
jgi:hypothetical protein